MYVGMSVSHSSCEVHILHLIHSLLCLGPIISLKSMQSLLEVLLIISGDIVAILVQVIWQYGTEGTKKKSAVVVCRTEAHLEQFEVFRTTWEQENGRRPLQSEVEALDECFWPLLIYKY